MFGNEDIIKVDLTEIGYGLDSTGSRYNSVTRFFKHGKWIAGLIEAI